MSIKNLVKATAVFSLVLASTLAFGQQMQQRSPQDRADRQTQWMQKNLALTADQSGKVHDIILKYAQQASNARLDGQKGARLAIMENRDAELKGVLTGNQFTQLQAHEQEMKEKMQQRRGNMQPSGN